MTHTIYVDAALNAEVCRLLRERHPERPPWSGGRFVVACYCRCRCGHAYRSHRVLTCGALACRLCQCAEHHPAEHRPSCDWPMVAEAMPLRAYHWLSEREAQRRERWPDGREAGPDARPRVVRP